VLRSIVRKLRYALSGSNESFPGSAEYWKERYAAGGSSGAGSYNKLAEFKAEVINDFVVRNQVQTVIEYGCGDGNQLERGVYSSVLLRPVL
jgi:hypothetical protein